MQYDYDYYAQGKKAFEQGKPRSACPDRLQLPGTYALYQIQDARNQWARGWDDAQRAAADKRTVAQDVLEQIAGDDSWADNTCEMADGRELSVDFQSMARELLAYRAAGAPAA